MTDSAPADVLILERTFDAPPALVWKLWTEPEHLKSWWGPQHFTAPVIKVDFQVGGKYLFSMQDADGKLYWSTGTYQEITPITRLVMTDSFSDEHGNIVSPSDYGIPDGFPEVLTVELTFAPVDDGRRTHMILRHIGMPASAAEFGAVEGWIQSFDKLNAAALALA